MGSSPLSASGVLEASGVSLAVTAGSEPQAASERSAQTTSSIARNLFIFTFLSSLFYVCAASFPRRILDQPLMAPSMTPFTRCFWMNGYRQIIGSAPTTIAANFTVAEVVSPPRASIACCWAEVMLVSASSL